MLIRPRLLADFATTGWWYYSFIVDYDEDDPRKEIERELETLVALGLVTVTGITDDGQWLYSVTEKARQMTEEERWDAIFGYAIGIEPDDDLDE